MRSEALLVAVVLANGARWHPTPLFPFEFVTVGSYRVYSDSTNFGEARKLLGSAGLQRVGHGHDAVSFICYLGGDAKDAFTLALETDDEMGGSEQSILRVRVVRRGYEAGLDRRCSPLRVRANLPTTDRGIHLGMTRHEIEKVLGRGGRDSSGVLIYERTETRKGSTCPTYDAMSSLALQFAEGRVVALSGYRGNFC
jgi:hypothetical protein